MPPADYSAGSACCPRNFSALADQRAEVLPVQRPLALAVGGRCMMRLTRLLMFPFFSLSIMDQLPLHRGAFQNAQRTCLETWVGYVPFNRPVNLVEIFERPKILPRRPAGLLPQQIQNSAAVGLELQDAANRPQEHWQGLQAGFHVATQC